MIDDFLNYLRYERNRSELTVRNYEKSLRYFESYFKNRESHLSWESVDSDIIRDWMESMMDECVAVWEGESADAYQWTLDQWCHWPWTDGVGAEAPEMNVGSEHDVWHFPRISAWHRIWKRAETAWCLCPFFMVCFLITQQPAWSAWSLGWCDCR